jgi:hypothetical protein
MTANHSNSTVYLGQVMHQRFGTVAYHFRYGVMSLKIDVDSFAAETAHLKLLSFNRFNLYSAHLKDYGARDGKPWREWANQLLAHYGLTRPAHRLELVCFPRFLGITFNPLAMWYAYDDQQQLIGVIAEVSNTFGQWHHYVLTQNGAPIAPGLVKFQAQVQKAFHVSPFIGMDCRYRFKFEAPSARYQIGIYQLENQQPVLTAVQTGKAFALNDATLLKAALKHPFNTLKVIALIHWWALKIWLKGGKFHKTPPSLQTLNHSHTEMTLC